MRKTVIRFYTIADFEEEEIWLRNMHGKGWKIVSVTLPCFYHFESCEPEDVIYRLDCKNSEQTPDYMQMLSDFGWENFEECTGWLYFRKPAKDVQTQEDGELFSDRESKTDFVKNIVITRLLPLEVIFLCCVAPNFVRYFSGNSIGVAGKLLTVFFGIMFVLYSFLITYCGIKLAKLRKKYGK